MNILVSPLPATVEVGGASVPIRTGYRIGIQVARAADSGLADALVAGTILRLYYADAVPEQRAAALDAAMEFHRLGQPVPKRRTRARRLLDWDHDAGMVLADFRREYGIDLADASTRMHWWVFMAYFNNLSADSQTKNAIYYRQASRPRDMSPAEAKRFSAMKKAYALPPRTVHDAEADEAAMWGDR